jgi:flagellar hook-basal body complex protein FliE
MTANITDAISAYSATAGRSLKAGLGPREDGASFGDVLEKASRDAIGTMHKSEQMSALGTLGKADITEVVQAVNNAETMLQTVTSLRDKVVSAYQEILRMPM